MSAIIPCQYFTRRSECPNNDNCMFDHVMIHCNTAPGQLLTYEEEMMTIPPRPDAVPTEYRCTRHLGGGVATFGSGAECIAFEPGPSRIWKPTAPVETKKHRLRLGFQRELNKYTSIEPALTEYLDFLTEAKKATFLWSNAGKGCPIISIVFDTAQTMAEAKETIASIVTGEIVSSEDGVVWHETFLIPKNWAHFGQIGESLSVVVALDEYRFQVTLHSRHDSGRKICAEEILRLFEIRRPDTFVLRLRTAQLQAALTGGFKTIVLELGKRRVYLDLTSTPRSIVIHGSKKDLSTAEAILKTFERKSRKDGRACAVCLTDEEPRLESALLTDQFFTTCNHMYCRECFEDLCKHPYAIPFQCYGIANDCRKILTLIEIQAGLPHSQFENVLSSSWIRYVNRDDTLCWCPTPGCPRIHRITNQIVVCQACSVAICTQCRTVNHVGMTCEVYQNKVKPDEMEYEDYKRANNFKDCPKCGIPIDKEGGCNHVHCPQCLAHFCFFCMRSFLDDYEISIHLRDGYCPQGENLEPDDNEIYVNDEED